MEDAVNAGSCPHADNATKTLNIHEAFRRTRSASAGGGRRKKKKKKKKLKKGTKVSYQKIHNETEFGGDAPPFTINSLPRAKRFRWQLL